MINQNNISSVDLFCGAGGLTHGFILEGLQVNAGIDLDAACRYPYEENNKVDFIEADIAAMGTEDVASLFTPGSIKVLAGCAPCQPFSTYSQRYDTESDGKWSLLNEFGRLVKAIRPEIVTMENVPTVARHAVFTDFRLGLEKLGYQVWSKVVDCSQYGVPQSRNRMVLMASLLGPIQLLAPTQKKPKTVKQAIGHLRSISAGELAPRDKLHRAACLSEKNLDRIKASKPGGTWRDWPRDLVADCHKRDTGRSFPSVYGRMEWDKPSPTMTTQCFGYGNGRFGHPTQDRAISLREAAILQSFPRKYRFLPPDAKVEFRSLGRMIGNAVPVNLGRAIASSILDHVSRCSIKPHSH
jgi:DNA (cytosine-5)-methyltransferase 1